MLGGVGVLQAGAASQSAEAPAAADAWPEPAAAGENGGDGEEDDEGGQPALTSPLLDVTLQSFLTVWPLVALLSVLATATVGFPVDCAAAWELEMAVPPSVAVAVAEAKAAAWWSDRSGGISSEGQWLLLPGSYCWRLLLQGHSP